MYKTGDTVLYGSEGVCKITDITEKQFGDVSIEYYILTPVFNNRSTFFVPTKNETLVSRMRPILTNREILDLITNAVSVPIGLKTILNGKNILNRWFRKAK